MWTLQCMVGADRRVFIVGGSGSHLRIFTRHHNTSPAPPAPHSVEEVKEAKDAEATKEQVAAAIKGALAKIDPKKVRMCGACLDRKLTRY